MLFTENTGDEQDEDLRRAIEESLILSEGRTVASESKLAASSEEDAPSHPLSSKRLTEMSSQSPQSPVSPFSSDSPTVFTTSPTKLSPVAYPPVHDVVIDENRNQPPQTTSHPSSISLSGSPFTLQEYLSSDTLSISTVATTAQQVLPETTDYDPLRRPQSSSHDSSSGRAITSEGPNSDHLPTPSSSLEKPVSQPLLLGPSWRVSDYPLPPYQPSAKIAPALRTSPSHNSIADIVVAPNNAGLTEYSQSPKQPSVRPRAGSAIGTRSAGITLDVSARPSIAQTLPRRHASPQNPVRPPMPDLSRESYLGDLMRGVCESSGL